MSMLDGYAADGSVLDRVDVPGESLLLACVNDQCPLVISSNFPEWKRHALGLECLFVLGRPHNETWVIAGCTYGGAPAETDRIQILDDEFQVLVDVEVSPHGWLIPVPRNLNWDSFYIRYLGNDEVLFMDGPNGHLTPYMNDGRDGKYPDRSNGGTGYAPLIVSDSTEITEEWPLEPESGYDIDLPNPEGGGWRPTLP